MQVKFEGKSCNGCPFLDRDATSYACRLDGCKTVDGRELFISISSDSLISRRPLDCPFSIGPNSVTIVNTSS